MKIELKEITLKKLSEDYIDNQEEGVLGYSGKLDIRPPYQREFIYDDKQRDLVINTVFKNFPLNVFYWAVKKDGTYEVIDGQQRTISICQFINGDFAYEDRYFHNLQDDEQEKILNYKIMVYFCSGTDSEKLDWFRTINIAGEQLTDQELRNAVYSGSWVTDAKRYFSKTGCPAYSIASDYMSGSPIRQDYLETAIKWISEDDIEEYMGKHQDDPTAINLWNYFQSVISWVDAGFTNKRKKFMKGVPWGELYNEFQNTNINPAKIEDEIAQLILDDDVTNKKGIYSYVLTRNEKYLSIRAFSDAMKQKVYELQKGICVECKEEFLLSGMEADHITPWHAGGKTNQENCQLLCKEDNRKKSGK
jgi:hypothetical protein